jgi:thiamine-phosphate pyrophosphorylase
MTDDSRKADWVAAASALPRGAAVIVRMRQSAAREALARAMIAALRPRGIAVLIAADWRLAWRLRADGVHLPEAQSWTAKGLKARWPRALITAAAHGAKGLVAANAGRADMALLSAAFPTASHAGRAALGPIRWALARQGRKLPVAALGGVTGTNAARLTAGGADALAVISAWIG